ARSGKAARRSSSASRRSTATRPRQRPGRRRRVSRNRSARETLGNVMLASLARFVFRHRLLVLGAWIALTAFGAFAASAVSSRWFESFSIPGYSAYETNQKALHT